MLRSILEQFLSKCWALISALFRYLLQFAFSLFQKLVSFMSLGDYGHSGIEENIDTNGMGLVMAFIRADLIFKLVVSCLTAICIVWIYKFCVKLLRG